MKRNTVKKMTKTCAASAFEFLVLSLCFLLVFPPQFVFAADPVPSGATETTVSNAQNGVPVVDIATPNGSGMSHNAFTSYNVDAHGLVLNNGDMSQAARLSELAGVVLSNPNLATGNQASIILNEVTGGGRTTLSGFTEVLGGRADVIIANPFGITSSGGGFLNTNQASLVTGTPALTGGNLNGFNVLGSGDILITGTGINANAAQVLNLVSRQIAVEGQVNAQTVNLIAGRNNWNHVTGDAIAHDPDGSAAPTWAIDSSALGGMYAGRINLQATEAGVGVRMKGEAAASADDFVITASGKIEISSKMYAARDLSITSKSTGADAIKATDANLTAARNLGLTAVNGDITLVGGGIKSGAELKFYANSLNDTASAMGGITDANTRDGNIITFLGSGAGVGAWAIDGLKYRSSGRFWASVGSLDLGSTAATLLYSDGKIAFNVNKGLFALNNVELQSAGDMDLFANSVDANGLLNIQSTAKVKSTSGSLNLKAWYQLTNEGALETTTGNIVIRAGSGTAHDSFINQGAGSIWAGGQLNVADRDSLKTQRILLKDTSKLGGVTGDISAHRMALADTAVLTSTGDMTIRLGDANTASTTIAAGAQILGATSETGTLTFTRDDLAARRVVANQGRIHSFGNLVSTNLGLGGTGATVSAKNDLSLQGYIGMTGNYIAGNDLTISNVGGNIRLLSVAASGAPDAVVYAGHDVRMNAAVIRNWSTINAGHDIIINASDMFSNAIGEGAPVFANHYYHPGSDTVVSNIAYRPEVIAGHAIEINTGGATHGQNSGLISAPTVNIGGGQSYYNVGIIRGTAVNVWGVGIINGHGGTDAPGGPTGATITAKPTPGGISFGGVTITIPTNPNGIHIPAQDSSSNYLVETNPLFTNIDDYLGSDYLAKKYNLDPDTLLKRLGDAAYETYLVRKQMIALTGSNIVVAGAQTEKAQMQALMDSAGGQAETLGLTYGKGLNSEQQANLKSDMIWMVETTVNGQKVLTPQVYLAANTRELFNGDALIAGDSVTANVQSMTNRGTIRGNNVDITASGNVLNEGGTIKGGDVAVTSTSGSVINTAKVTETVIHKADGHIDLKTTVGKGGTIEGTNSVKLKAAKDVVNAGSTIKGGEVNLEAGRDVVNKAIVSTNVTGTSYKQHVAAESSISSTGDINVDAGRDVNNLGAQMNAAGDANLSAGRDVNIDTVELKNSETSTSSTRSFIKNTDTRTTTTSTTQVQSGISSGGNMNIKAKNDVTLGAANLNAGQDVNIDAGNDVNVLARSNSVETKAESSTSGAGVGGGLLGMSKSSTDALSSRAQVSSITSGGNTNLSAEKTVTLEGAKLNSGKDINISGTDVNIVEARDVDRVTTHTETTSFLSVSKGEGDTSSSSSSSGTGASSAEAGAQASASHDAGGIDFKKTTKTNTFDETTKAVGSQLSAKGGLNITSKKDMLLRGADVKTGGDVTLTGENVDITAAQDTSVSMSTTEVSKVGLYANTTNKADAGADAGASASAKKVKANASANANAEANAASKTNIDFVRNKTTKTATVDITNKGTTLSSGGNLKINAAKTLTVKGSDVSGEKGVDVKAKDMRFLAAEDVHTSVTTVEKNSTGLYIDGDANANANANANAKAGLGLGAKANAGGSASANAKAEVSVGVRNKNKSTTDAETTTTARVSTITSGSGSVKRTAENDITDVGTAIDAAGDYSQSSKTYTSKAAKNTSFKVSKSSDSTVKAGVYGKAEAGANAQAGASAGVGRKGKAAQANASAKVNANVGAGVKTSYDKNTEQSLSSSSDAVVTNIKSGGKMKIVTTGATSLEGTKLSGAKGVEIEAGSLDFKAAKNTTSSSSSSSNVNAAASVGVTRGTGKGVEASASGGTSKSEESASSSTAVVGGIESSGGGISITTKDNTRLEGTNLSAAKDTNIKAGGDIVFDAARDTKQSSKSSSDVSAGLDIGKSSSAAKSSSGINLNAEGGTSKSSSSSSTATAGSINTGGKLNLNSGKSVTLEGTKMKAGGDATISAKDGVNFNAAKSTSESKSVGARLGGKVGKAQTTDATETTTGKSVSGKAEANFSRSKESIAEAGSLTSGGNLVIKSGKDVTLEGTDLSAKKKASINAGGAVNFKAAKSTSESTNIGASVSGSKSKTTKTPRAAPKKAEPATPKTPAPSTKAKNTGTGGTQGSDGSKKSDKALGSWQKKHENVMQELKAKQNKAAPVSKAASAKPAPKAGSPKPAPSTMSKKVETPAPTPAASKSAPKPAHRTSVSKTIGTPTETPPSTDYGVPTTEIKTPTKVSPTLELKNTTEEKAGSIKAGAGGIEINAGGGDVNLVGTNMDTTGDAKIKAQGNVKVTATKKTESSLGGRNEQNQGATIKSGGQVYVSSGGKATLVNTDIKAANGEAISAVGGVERKTVQDIKH